MHVTQLLHALALGPHVEIIKATLPYVIILEMPIFHGALNYGL